MPTLYFVKKNHQWKKTCPFNKVQSDPLTEIVWYKKKKREILCATINCFMNQDAALGSFRIEAPQVLPTPVSQKEEAWPPRRRRTAPTPSKEAYSSRVLHVYDCKSWS